jgi:Domain of unknown function (DUF4337)
MHDVLEGLEEHGGHGGHGENPLMLPVTVTLSILAVLVAMVTLLGHRAHTEELLLQAKASDQWAYFQAKNIRLRETQSMADVLGALAPADKEKTDALHDKYLKEVERYEKDKDQISDQAKDFEKERDLVQRRADRYDAGEVFLEIALIICSFTLLTKKKGFWFAGMLLGVVGLIIATSGFLLH